MIIDKPIGYKTHPCGSISEEWIWALNLVEKIPVLHTDFGGLSPLGSTKNNGEKDDGP